MVINNTLSLLESIHGHIKALNDQLDTEIVCFEAHPEGVYVQVTREALERIPLPLQPDTVLNIKSVVIAGIVYEFYAFNKRKS